MSDPNYEARMLLALQALQNDPKLSVRRAADTIHNPSFGITPLSASKIKKASPKLINFTYTNIGQNK
jgi:hypothetical protein